MNKFIMIVVLVAGMTGFLKQDPVLKNRTNVYDEKGKKTGFIKKNNVLDRHDIFNSSGRCDGYLKYNRLIDRWEIRKTK